jgi:hypothetical protein
MPVKCVPKIIWKVQAMKLKKFENTVRNVQIFIGGDLIAWSASGFNVAAA